MFYRRTFILGPIGLALIGSSSPSEAAEAPLTLRVNIRPEKMRPGVNVVYIDTPHGYISVMGDDDIPLMIWLMQHAGKADLKLEAK